MTQMGKDDSALPDLMPTLPFKLAQQILIGEPMKTITLHPLAANQFRQWIETSYGRHRGVKRRIETGHLKRSGKVF